MIIDAVAGQEPISDFGLALASAPVAATTSRTASKIRSGRFEAASRRRQ
jgi:hypothetical protein